jgi:predicted DCC family thiol-disulfide oxidoreductase YuxK
MKIIFFDGVCGLCDGFVQFILKIDKDKKFHFSPLQSDFARIKLSQEYTNDLKTLVLMKDEKLYFKSCAIIHILLEIGGVWKIAIIGRIFPSFILDFLYDLIAKHRYKTFGIRKSCRLPGPDEKSRFVI